MQHQAVTMQHTIRPLHGLLSAADKATTQMKVSIQFAHDVLDELFFTRATRVNEMRVDIAEGGKGARLEITYLQCMARKINFLPYKGSSIRNPCFGDAQK